MIDTSEIPETLDDAIAAARTAAVERAVTHSEIVSQAQQLEPRVEAAALRSRLDEANSELLATCNEPVLRLHELYQTRERLLGRARVQGEEPTAWLRGGTERGAKRSQQRLEESPEWKKLVEATQRVVGRLESELVDRAMVPHLRRWLNERREAQEEQNWKYRRNLDDVDTSELRSPVTKDSFQETERLGQLGRLIARMPGGSIGIAGPRGSGKSTAIKNVHQLLASQSRVGSTYDVFAVSVPAPVEYVPKEFLVHLHEEVCERWLSRSGSRYVHAAPSSLSERSPLLWPLLTCVVPAALGLAGVALVARFVRSNGVEDYGTVYPLIVVLATSVAATLLGLMRASNIRHQREYILESQEVVSPSTFPGDYVLGAMSGLRARGAVAAAMAIAVIASGLLQLHASGSVGWLTSRHLVAVLLLVAGGCAFALPTRPATRAGRSPLASAVLGVVMTVGLAAASHSVAMLVLPTSLYAASLELVAGGVLVAGACFLVAVYDAKPRIEIEPVDPSSSSVSLAEDHLRRLRFQRTEGSSWSAGMKVGGSPYLPASTWTLGGTASDVEVPTSTPAVIAMITRLLTKIRDENPEVTFKIVIGIDELDKLEGEDGARTFLNEIKGLFTIPGVVFLVSVSEDAMASFERRGLAFRDVFDSAFDEILHLPQLALGETRDLVGRRISNMPRPYVALAHCLSGGLARDVIRAIDHMTDTVPPQELARVTEAVVHREVRGKWQAVVAAVRPIPLEPQVTDLLKALYPIDRCVRAESDARRCLLRTDAFDLVDRLDLPVPPDSELVHFRTLQRLGGEYLGFAYFCRTLLEFFDVATAQQMARFAEAEVGDMLDRGSLDYLARARQHLGINPRLAWEQISSFRKARGLTARSFPDSLLGSRSTSPPVAAVAVPSSQVPAEGPPELRIAPDAKAT